MPTAITLKNIPDDLYDRLKEAASAHHRSINREAITCLMQVLLPVRASASEHLASARQLRATLKRGKFKASEITRTIAQGRP